jgi:hypothetical protein
VLLEYLHWWCNIINNNNYSNEQSNISYSLFIHSIFSLEEKDWIQTFYNNSLFQFITILYNSRQNTSNDAIVISKHHEWMKCTSKCFKDNNKASHFVQLWIIYLIFVKHLRKIAIRQIYVIFTFLEQNCTNTCIISIHC